MNDSVYSNPSSTPISASVESQSKNSTSEKEDFDDDYFEPFSEVVPTKKASIIKLERPERPVFAVQHSVEISRQPPTTTTTEATTKVWHIMIYFLL